MLSSYIILFHPTSPQSVTHNFGSRPPFETRAEVPALQPIRPVPLWPRPARKRKNRRLEMNGSIEGLEGRDFSRVLYQARETSETKHSLSDMLDSVFNFHVRIERQTGLLLNIDGWQTPPPTANPDEKMGSCCTESIDPAIHRIDHPAQPASPHGTNERPRQVFLATPKCW